jgi:cation:H+ antiporter
MEMTLFLLGGLVLLVAGGELLVRGAVGVATRFGVSPLVIGLTLVGFGTSTPELVTSVQAALGGYPGVAYGNIVGSNIANVLLILGITSILCPIVVARSALKRDGLTMLAVAAVFVLLAALMPMGRAIGLAFLLALAGYIYLAFRQERGGAEHGAAYDKGEALLEAEGSFAPPVAAAQGSIVRPLLMALAGIGAVVAGGALLVDGAVSLARLFGVSETVIGLTIVAIGTSLPELVTSVMAALRRQTDVAFGNIVGSNIYNILGIGGATALVSPGSVPAEIIRSDNLVMLGVSVLLIVFTFTGRRLDRWEGCVLLGGYASYLVWLTTG